jgi:hypothetical protein
MASTKRSALAPGFTVDTTALHQYNTTNFVQYASLEQQATSSRPQAKVSSHEQQASSREQQGSSSRPRAATQSVSYERLEPSRINVKIRELLLTQLDSEGLNFSHHFKLFSVYHIFMVSQCSLPSWPISIDSCNLR